MADIAKLQIAVETKGASEATSALKDMGNAAAVVEDAVKKLAKAWAALKLAEQVKDAAMLAARYETLGVVMGVLGNNAGYTKAEMVEFQKALMQTGISAVESRNTLNMMASAQMDLTKSSQLARVAQDAAVVGNLNSSEAFQRMIYGIQSGQTEILRTIGINVNFENSYKALAKELKKNVAELTEHEKVQARTNVVMEKGKDIAGAYEASMGTAGKQLASSKRYAEDLQVSLGSVFQPSLINATKAYVEALKGAKEWTEKNKGSLDALSIAMGAATQAVIDMGKSVLGLTSDVGEAYQPMQILTSGIEGLGFAAAVVADAFKALRLQFKNMTAGAVDQLAFLTDAWAKAAGAMGMSGVSGRLGALSTQLQFGAAIGKQEADKFSMGETSMERFLRLSEEKRKEQERSDKIRKKGPDKPDDSKAAEAYAKELERQLGFMRGMRDELEKAVYTEDELLQIRIKRANLSPAMEREAQALAKLLEMARSAIKPNQQLVESLEKFEELSQKMAAIRPGVQNTAQAFLDAQMSEYQSEISRRYNSEGYAKAELNRLMANRSQFDPETYARAFRDLRAQASETWYLIEEGSQSAASTMADAFAQFAMTGEMSVKKMTQAILTDLIRLTSQSAFRQLLNFGMGFLTGGGGSEGVSTGTSLSLPDLTPVPTGPVLGLRGGGAGGGMNVTVNVANQGATVDAQGGGAIGKKMGEAMRAAAMEVLRSESNPGGFLYKRVNA